MCIRDSNKSFLISLYNTNENNILIKIAQTSITARRNRREIREQTTRKTVVRNSGHNCLNTAKETIVNSNLTWIQYVSFNDCKTVKLNSHIFNSNRFFRKLF